MLSYLSLKIGFQSIRFVGEPAALFRRSPVRLFCGNTKGLFLFFRRPKIEESEQHFAISNYGSRPEALSIYYIGKECR